MKKTIDTYAVKWFVTLFTLLVFLGNSQAYAVETITYYHTDALGSPVAGTNEAGDLLWKEDYLPYGERIRKQAESESNARWYTGHIEDKETGLTYAGARHYDPVTGRFLAIDPVGFQEDNLKMFNRYAYANNNPFKYVDPDGHAPKFPSTGKHNVGPNHGGNPIVSLSVRAAKKVLPKDVFNKLFNRKLSGKNPPINQDRQKLHTNGTEGKSQFKDNVDADNLVQDTWKNGTPKFNKNGEFIGKVKQYKDEVGTQGQKSVDTRFSRKKGVHGFPSNKSE